MEQNRVLVYVNNHLFEKHCESWKRFNSYKGKLKKKKRKKGFFNCFVWDNFIV